MRSDLHYTLTRVDEVPAVAGATVPPDLVARYNVAPGQSAPVVVVRNSGRVCEHMRWGLLPRWRGHGGKRGAPTDRRGTHRDREVEDEADASSPGSWSMQMMM
jgi:putative SOS response-associated peptidase YedK